MSENTWWSKFEKTGSVIDYLSYKGICCQDESLKETETGDETFESKNNSDRDDFIGQSYR